MAFKIDDKVYHVVLDDDYRIVATKDLPYKGNKVPDGYDYLIILIGEGFKPFIPCHEEHLEPRN
jgi:hypothetical protein